MAKIIQFPSKKVDVKPQLDLSDRGMRIKASLDRINALMAELKKMSQKEGGDDVRFT